MRKFKILELKKKEIFLKQSDINHLKKVLRKKNNSTIVCYDEEKEYICNLKTQPEFKVNILKENIVDLIKPYNINMYVGVIKKNNFETLVNFLNELNVKSITPVYFERSQKNINLNFHRLNLIIENSCKQCERKIPLQINNSIYFKDLIDLDLSGINIVANLNNSKVINEKIFKKGEYNLFIGPEGGFSDYEIKWFSKNFFQIELNHMILRTETAAISFASILISKVFFKT